MNKYAGSYLLMLVLQLIICNYVNISPMVMLSVLPMLILFLPMRCSRVKGMLIAFATGIAVDFFADGILGLNAIALIPVAYFRPTVIRMVFGEEVIARKENISLRKNGAQKVLLSLLIVQSIFLLIYVWVDSAGTRSFSFNLARLAFSVLSGVFLSFPLSGLFSFDDRQKRWR